MTIKGGARCLERGLPLIESMTIKVVRENRNPRDQQIKVGDLISVVGHDPTRRTRAGQIGLVTEIGAEVTCPDYVIAVFPHLGETVVYADEWEVLNA
jgi:hypothetical protein